MEYITKTEEKQKLQGGILYVVGSPIGNLEDITLRALRILKEVDLILCEDTRVTKKLLNHYEIKNTLMAYPSDGRLYLKDSLIFKRIVGKLFENKKIALLTDAGTPGISDPGNLLVARLHKETDFKIEAIPGPSALISAISIAGFPVNEFTFLGFPPNKKGRMTFFKKLAFKKETVFFFESKHRILKTLQALVENLTEDRKIFIGRELTKFYGQSVVGKPSEILEIFQNDLNKIKGEFVVGISSSRDIYQKI